MACVFKDKEEKGILGKAESMQRHCCQMGSE